MKIFKTLEEIQAHNDNYFENNNHQNKKSFDKDGLSYFERITHNSRPHDVFKSNWTSFGSISFASKLLAYTNGIKAKGLRIYDGAELFNNVKASERKLFIFDENKSIINLINYTYPKGVKAEERKNDVTPAEQELLTFIEINENESIDISFKFGRRFKEYLKTYLKNSKKSNSISTLENKTYTTNKNSLKNHFNNSLVHYDMMNYILKTLKVDIVAKKHTVSSAYFATKEKDKENYTKVDKIKLEEELYIIVEGKDVKDKKVFINILDKDNTIDIVKTDNDEKLVPVLIDKKEHSKIESTFDKKDPNDKTGKKYFTAIKIKLKPSKDEDLKKMYENIDKTKKDKANLYLLADIHTANSDIKKEEVIYEGKNKGDDKSISNHWLDEDGKYLEVSFNNCGYEYIKKFQCTKFGSAYGPVYWGVKKLAQYDGWATLIKDKKITEEEKEILIGMSENEGKLDSVQSYDSEILTAGAMQKTVNPQGKGELPIQIEEFKKDHPKKYKSLFEDCGWTVDNKTIYYKNLRDKEAKKITGKDLKTKIREGFTKDTYKKKVRCAPLEPIVKAVNDKDFQAKQLKDFIDRLKNKVLVIKPKGHTSYKLKDYLKSKLGKATALDHHINRPGYVATDFGKALDNFFTKKDKEIEDANKLIEKENKEITDPKLKKEKKKKVSRKPSEWGDKHTEYEKDILEDYGKNRRGTDMENRYKKMKAKL